MEDQREFNSSERYKLVSLKSKLYLNPFFRKNGKKFWVGTLTNVTESDSGNYTCLVKNHSGENGSNTINLLVDGEFGLSLKGD